MLRLVIGADVRSISAIEIPGIVEGDGEEAVKSLGGLSTLSKSLGKDIEGSNASGCTAKMMNSDVFLRCSLGDRYSSFLGSTTKKKSDILLKYRRDKGPRSTAFDVDYELNENASDPLFVPPPVFTHIVSPFHYTFEESGIFSTKADTSESHKTNQNRPIIPTPQPALQHNAFTAHSSIMNESCDNTVVLCDVDELVAFSNERNDISNTDDRKEFPFRNQETSTKAVSSRNVSRTRSSSLSSPSSFSSSSSPSSLSSHRREKGQAPNNLNSVQGCSTPISAPSKKNCILNATCQFDTVNVPHCPPVGALRTPVDVELLATVQHLFNDRPIWIRSLLDLQLPSSITAWRKKPLLGRTCFLLTDGPWRGAYCRMGYDPRKDPESRKYQTIDFRDSYFRSIVWKLQASLTVGENMTDKTKTAKKDSPPWTDVATQSRCTLNELTFRAPPSRPSQLYQLCDISDVCVQQVVQSAVPTKTCSKTSGWFSRDVLTKVRDLMLLVSKKMREPRQTIQGVDHEPPCSFPIFPASQHNDS